MSKHTEKPWRYDAGHIVHITSEGDCITVAEMHSTFGPDHWGVHQWRLDPEEYDANGRLIVAAPEMYELIERAGEIMIELESLINAAYFSKDTVAQKSQWHKDVAALLAKIEGGDQ